jgi:UDPglucose 6-dehydrogenase
MKQTITIGCVGMTHLGLIHAVAFAEKGFNLIGFDNNEGLINELQRAKPPVKEPQLDELIMSNAAAGRLHFTSDIQQLTQCSLVFIACDVPTDDKGNSNLSMIHELIKKTLPVLSQDACFILLSQVPPGFTRQINLPKERLFYQVETLIFGLAMERALYPERYIVGTNSPNLELPKAYLQLLHSFNCPILKMRYESAELAKISINMFLVSSVSTTNTLAELCENIGADWEEIAPALRLDKRIGPHAYLTPGLGIAGGNLERDLNTIIKLGNAHETETGVVSAWLKNSHYRRDWVLRCLKQQILAQLPTARICILGLAYKQNTHSIKNSPSIALIEQLKEHQGHIQVHDPVVENLSLPNNVSQHKSLHDALSGADVAVIMTPWDAYRDLSMDVFKQTMQGRTLIDPYRLVKINPAQSVGFKYFSLGQGPIEQQTHQAVDKEELMYV